MAKSRITGPCKQFLFVQFTNEKAQLLPLTGEQLKERTRSPSKAYRVSPIFPVIPEEARAPLATANYYVGFFFFEDPLIVIGQIIADVPKQLQRNLWFSHGLASIILFTDNVSDFETIKKTAPKLFRGLESWRVNNSEIAVLPLDLPAAVQIDSKHYKIETPTQLDIECQTIINELRHCLNTAVARAMQFLPSSLKTFERLYPAVTDIIDELIKLESGTLGGSELVFVSSSGDYANPGLSKQKRKQQLADQLIQINAALSYVISQAYAGIAPILQHECQIRKYSLLGIGSAHNGMAAFTEFCELTFQRFPVDTAVKQEFKKPSGFSFELTGSDTPADWDDPKFNVDAYIEDVESQQSKLNLAYFSGRLGFRETQFTVTAPLQTLTDAGTARWSLMTLTHELMHAHVRAILAAIFSPLQTGDPAKAFEACYENFRARAKEEKAIPKSLLETLQFIILNYCDKKPSVDRAIEKFAQLSGTAPIAEPVRTAETGRFTTRLQAYYREINEIMVHVLDFNYFYDCREEPYLTLLWTSWAPVASVIDNVEEYLLRSILAISPKTTGDNASRFSQAVLKLKQVLSQLTKKRPTDPLFTHALSRIQNELIQKQLLSKYCLAIYLVDMTQKALVCKRVHAGLYTDANRVKKDLNYSYVLETGQFEPLQIASPVAFVADLLRRELNGEKHSLTTEYVSAWLFLVCASAPIERTPNVS